MKKTSPIATLRFHKTATTWQLTLIGVRAREVNFPRRSAESKKSAIKWCEMCTIHFLTSIRWQTFTDGLMANFRRIIKSIIKPS